jgi:type III restriction enzyme
MKNKELLLDGDPKRSPVRFIFSHSALREGWDNPNVFQICTLKQSSSEVRKRQEVGRGLRLSVNRDGERMDENVLGNDVHNINVLTVIASESYDSFAKGLQAEIAEAVSDRPSEVTADLFTDKVIRNARANHAERRVDEDKPAMPEFKALWEKIRQKSVCVVDFDTGELVKKAISSLNGKLRIPKIFFKVETGEMEGIDSKEALISGEAFVKDELSARGAAHEIHAGRRVKYDLVGKLVGETGLTRRTVIAILQGIEPQVFGQFQNNPEEFILKAANLINEEKETAIVRHIT